MRIDEVMTRDVQTVRPDQPVQEAASFMLSADAGSIPVTEGERLIAERDDPATDEQLVNRTIAELPSR